MRHWQIDPELPLLEAPTKQPGLRWPLPIDLRLDDLVSRANRGGANTNRQELAAALILSSGTDPAALFEAVLALRRAMVREALLDVEAAGGLPLHGPGRRTRKPRAGNWRGEA
jgi:hypothetical protein